MNAEALNTRIQVEPSELILSSGNRYTVNRPEMILILKNRVLVSNDPRGPRSLPDTYTKISYLNSAGAEPLGARSRGKSGRRK